MVYTPIPDRAGLRRGARWLGSAGAYQATAYDQGRPSSYGPRRTSTSIDLMEMTGVPMRASVFRFEVLDEALTVLGTLDVDRDNPPTVKNDTTRTIFRTLDDLTVDPVTAADLDTIEARIRPVATLEDGTDWPLGVFLFVDASRPVRTVGRELSGSLHDLLFEADQGVDETVAYPRGTNLATILEDQAAQVGYPLVAIDATNRVLSKPIAWPAGTKRLAILTEVATMAGMLAPYMANDGTFTCRKAPSSVDFSDPDLRYKDGGRIIANSATESDDLLDSPNRWIVIDDSSTDAPVVGVYDLPSSSPVSIARRGFPVADVQTLQGLDGPDAANEAAMARAINAGLGFEVVTFDAIPDYRHDTHDDIEYLGEVYRETSWSLPCSPLAVMTHEARKVYS